MSKKRKIVPEKISESDTSSDEGSEEGEAALPENLSESESDTEPEIEQPATKKSKLEKIKLDNFPTKLTKSKEPEHETKKLKAEQKAPVKESTKKSDNKPDTDDPTPDVENKKPRKSIPDNTIFVGNLPINTKLKQLRAHFKPYGEITSIWFRSENGRKIMNKSDRKKYGNLIAYISFKDHDNAMKATEEQNGKLFKENHLRVDLKSEKIDKFSQDLNKKSTVFVGNLQFEATDEELYNFFTEKCGPVEYVRRIPKKGVAFVCFKKGTPIVRALKLNNEDFQGRKLRIEKWEAKEKLQKKEKKLIKKGKKKLSSGNVLDTSRPSNNPLIKKIREKKKIDNTVDKKEFKKKFREDFRDGGKKATEGKPVKKPFKKEFNPVSKSEKTDKPKPKGFVGRKPMEKKKRSRPQSSLTKKKKKHQEQKVKKIAKFLTGKKK